jgi:hypothetical protein
VFVVTTAIFIWTHPKPEPSQVNYARQLGRALLHALARSAHYTRHGTLEEACADRLRHPFRVGCGRLGLEAHRHVTGDDEILWRHNFGAETTTLLELCSYA